MSVLSVVRAQLRWSWVVGTLIFTLIVTLILTAQADEADTPLVPGTAVTASASASHQLGERLYREGVLPSGKRISGLVEGDVPGEQLVCVSCHGRSGLGSGEGAIFTPSITGLTLFEPKEIRRKELHGSRSIRPAYTDESLRQAIRRGVDANGQRLDDMMPRYALSDEDLDLLIPYLKTLSSNFSPGVTDTTIHFATVVAGGVDPEKRKAMFDVLNAFFKAKNTETRSETKRARRGPYYREWWYQAYRKWELHVWELDGPSDSWQAQLEAQYRKQPVFALISGIGAGSWQPVHGFCEQFEVPCLLPNTDLPVTYKTDFYPLYFSKGITLEAEALAKHLQHLQEEQGAIRPVIQVYRDDERGVVAATALRKWLENYGITELEDRHIPGDTEITPDFWRELLNKKAPPLLVLWLGDSDLAGLNNLAKEAAGLDRVYLSSTLLDTSSPAIPSSLQEKVYRLHPFELPDDLASRFRRIKVWMRGKGVQPADERLQANVLFTLTLVSHALKHIGSNFYRDYFIEKIEHVLDNMVMPSAYPNPTLAPNQRFAAKGCYIVRLGQGPEGEPVTIGDWVVP